MKMSELKDKGIPYPLVRAVVRQSGGWESFCERAPDITNYGMSGGFSGWIYYDETTKFWQKNRTAIVELAENMAREFGIDVLTMVRNFNSIRGEYTESEIGKALYGRYSDDYITVYNVMSWFAAEEVARLYCDMRDIG